METTAYNTGNPFKILKMINGEDVLCKILTAVKNQEAVEEKQKVTTGLPKPSSIADGFF